eukprot:TRINITY_DN31481_c0_g1_i1.p1 TRINITY_DN31481_c0_g1~~TRINITY_DN31481_c0_g1_i1.p1  ORF type:complete len:355 (-),score=121.68 TRINITY_DN31481_c0_g1_i1:28-1092(-)
MELTLVRQKLHVDTIYQQNMCCIQLVLLVKIRVIWNLALRKKDKFRDLAPLESFKPNNEINKKVALIKSDITSLELDAIVNAANRSLLGGGGIDGAIHRAAGSNLYRECETLNGADTGKTKITRGYNLPAKYVLHTVGPIGENKSHLESCYTTCLQLVSKHEIKSVAFCGISTGIYGYPLYKASHVALHVIRKWLEVEANRNSVDLIVLCTFLPKELVCYEELMPLYFPPEDSTPEAILTKFKDSYEKYDASKDVESIKAQIEQEIKEKKEKKNAMNQDRANVISQMNQLNLKNNNNEKSEEPAEPSDKKEESSDKAPEQVEEAKEEKKEEPVEADKKEEDKTETVATAEHTEN